MTTNNQLTFQPGKFYKTRDGRKREVVLAGRDFGGGYTMLVVFEHGNGRYGTDVYTSDGKVYPNHQQPADLIAEWKDAPEVDWSKMPEGYLAVVKDANGRWYAYEHTPEAGAYHWLTIKGFALPLYPQHVPKWSGDWRESLVARPTEETK